MRMLQMGALLKGRAERMPDGAAAAPERAEIPAGPRAAAAAGLLPEAGMTGLSETERGPGRPSRIFGELLLKFQRILVIGHQHPDGDALGSAAALACALRGLGKTASAGISGRVPANIAFLMDPLKHFPAVPSPDCPLLRDFELIVYVDCHGPSRVWPGTDPALWAALPPNLIIDHHVHNEELQGALAVFHDRTASSTGELIVRLFRSLGLKTPAGAVDPLLTAIVTDTGFFTQDNTTSSCLREAADLVALGGKPARLHELLFCGNSLPRMKLLKNSLSSLELFLEGRVAVMLLSEGMLEDASARIEDADGFIDYPRSLQSVLLAAFIKGDGQGGTKVSLRSRPPVSARKIAPAFGGGGHDLAAAYQDPSETPEAARARFLEAAERYFLEGRP